MIGNVVTKKDLEIFRGTYNEVMAQETVNMKIYLAWDTQEIYIGNTVGQKIQYGVSKTIYRRVDEKYLEIEEKMRQAVKDEVSAIVPGLVEAQMESAHQAIRDEVSKAINELKVEIGTHIGVYEHKVDSLDGRVTQHIRDVKNEIKDVRDRLELLVPGATGILDFGHDEEIDYDFGDDSEEEEPNG